MITNKSLLNILLHYIQIIK